MANAVERLRALLPHARRWSCLCVAGALCLIGGGRQATAGVILIDSPTWEQVKVTASSQSSKVTPPKHKLQQRHQSNVPGCSGGTGESTAVTTVQEDRSACLATRVLPARGPSRVRFRGVPNETPYSFPESIFRPPEAC